MAREQIDQKKIEKGIANIAAVIKQIASQKRGIIGAANDLNEIIKIAAAVSDALNSPEAKKTITVAARIDKILGNVIQMVQSMNKLIEQVARIKPTSIAFATINTKLLVKLLKPLQKTIRSIIEFTRIKGLSVANGRLPLIWALLNEFSRILIVVSKMRTVLLKRKVVKLSAVIRPLHKLIRGIIRLSRVRDARRAATKLLTLRLLFNSFRQILMSAMMLAPAGMLFLMVAPILIVCLWAASKVLKILIRVMVHLMRSPLMLIATVAIGGLLLLNTALFMLGLSILALGLIAIPALMALPIVLIFMAGLIGLVVIFILFGAIMNLAGPLLMVAVAGVALLMIAVLCLVVIAFLLTVLQDIELDIDKIKENVKKVLDTASQVILWVGEPLSDDDSLARDAGSEKASPGLLSMFNNGLIKVIGALYGVAILVPILISVACILLIAAMLRLLQNLDLDFGRIRDNVMMVFEVTDWILEYITTPQNDRFSDSDKIDAVSLLGGFVYKPILKILDAIAGAAFLIVMILAVLSVLLIATMLRLLQTLDLDEGKILDNVRVVFSTCQEIIDSILSPDTTEPPGSSLGIFGMLIGWVCSPLARLLDAIFAIAYLALVLVAIMCFVLIASMLRLLQNLDLKEDTIMENTRIVLRTTQYLIDTIYNPDEENDEKSSRGVLGTLIGWVYKPLAKVLDAVFALAYLAVMVIAILCVLAIAGLLRLLQNLDLKEDKIRTNAEIALRTCSFIIERIFCSDEENDEQSSRGPIRDFLGWVFPSLSKMIDAIFAMAYLAVMMIAIMCLLGIAKMLELVGQIDAKILEQAKENARLTMDTALLVSSYIYKEDEETQSQSSRGGLAAFISWVDPGLGQIFQAVLTIAYLALSFIAITIVLGLAKLMEQLGKIDRAIMNNAIEIVKLVMSTSDNIVNRVYQGEDKGSQASNRGVLLKIVEWVAGKPIADIMAAMLTIAYLALVFLAIYIVAGIAKSLNTIGGIDRDKVAKARDNVDFIMSTANYVVDKVMSQSYTLREHNDKNLSALLKWLLPAELKSILGAIMTIQALAFAQVMIGSLQKIAEGLATVAKIDTSTIGTAKQKAVDIVSASGDILKQMKTDITGQFTPEEFKNVSSVITNLSHLMSSVASIGDSLHKLSQQTLSDEGIEQAVKKTIKIYQGCLAIIEAIAQPAKESKSGWTTLVNGLASSLIGVASLIIFDDSSEYSKRLKSLDEVIRQATGAIKSLIKLMQEMPKLLQTMNAMLSIKLPNMGVVQNSVKSVWHAVSGMILGLYKSLIDDEDATYLSKDNYNELIEIVNMQAKLANSLKVMTAAMSTVFKNVQALSTWFPIMARIDVPARMVSTLRTVFNCLVDILRAATGAAADSDWETINSAATRARNTTGAVLRVMRGYTDMMPIIQTTINSITALQVDENSVLASTRKVKSALKCMFEIISAASIPVQGELVRSNMDLMDRINESITSFTHVTTQDVKNSKDLTDNYIAFLTKVNSMDFTKLKTTEQLMKHWADMSRTINGNFQGLAQAINEHIMPTLKGLNKTMDESLKVQRQIIKDLSEPIDASRLTGGGAPITPMDPIAGAPAGGTPKAPHEGAGYSPSSSSYYTENTGGATDYIPTEELAYGGNIDDSEYTPEKEPIGDGPSFISPYSNNMGKLKKSAIERIAKALDGDALRVKIIN